MSGGSGGAGPRGRAAREKGGAAPAARGAASPRDESRAAATLFRVIVPVGDIDRAAEFYGHVLGIPGERVAPSRHYFDCGAILACLDPRVEGWGYDATPNPEHIYFAVADLDAAYARAEAAGCTWLEQAPSIRSWGERSFYAEDPFGNPLCFVEETTVFRGG